MVVVTKAPEVVSSARDDLKLLKPDITTHLDFHGEDTPLTASVIQPNQDINTVFNVDSNNVPHGLKNCKKLIRKAILEKNGVLLTESCIGLRSEFSVLTILECYSFLNEISPFNDEPSAPPPYEIDFDWMMIFQKNIAKCQEECDKILNEKTFEVFLNVDEVMKLRYKDLLGILKRNNLNVTDEEFLYDIMYDWAKRHSSNYKHFQRTLGELPNHIRFGTMKPKTFKNLKGIQDVLNEKDLRAIRFYLKEKAKGRDTHELPHQWSEPRTISNDFNKSIIKNRKLERAGLYCLICWMSVFD